MDYENDDAIDEYMEEAEDDIARDVVEIEKKLENIKRQERNIEVLDNTVKMVSAELYSLNNMI